MSGMRVVMVPELGEDAVIVDIEPRALLLLDAALDYDRRMQVMAQVMAEEAAS